MTLDRKAFIDIITLGQGDVGGAMHARPEGVWGIAVRDAENPTGLRYPDVGKEPGGSPPDHGQARLRAPISGWRSRVSVRNIPAGT